MLKARINGIDVYYELSGRGPVVVFCHGEAGNHLSWWQQVPEFSKQYRCLTYDLRGFGQSLESYNGPGPSALVEDLYSLLHHLGIRDIRLVSHSLGCVAGMGFALKYPSRVRSLVLAGSHGNVVDTAIRRKFQQQNGVSKDPASYALSPRLQRERPSVHFLHQEIMALNPPLSSDYLYQAGSVPPPPKVLFNKFSFPTLFVVGEEDPVTPPELVEMAQQVVPNSRMVKLPKTGHSPPFERPEIFNYEVLAFLEAAERVAI
jgi:pimeloyl-ACP methyl ester carboxylesterase